MQQTSNNFRPDIELLRGLAVILVVLYHLKIDLFRSGFIGVDIFFVISGYLMAAAFYNGSTTYDFYMRRARRVLPAALVVMIAVFLAGPLFFLPFESEKLSYALIGALLLVPNVTSWQKNDYFADLDFSPTLHYITGL